MVGYQEQDTLSTSEKLIAGAFSGALTRSMTQPLDVVKLRVQLQKPKKVAEVRRSPRVFSTIRKILNEEGLRAFWHGHRIGQIHSVVAVSSQFHFFELATSFTARYIDKEGKHRRISNYICGWFAGCASAIVVNPLEVIRVRQMVSVQYQGFFNGMREVYKRGGIRAFYQGISAALLQMGPSVALTFGVFSTVQPLILLYLESVHKRQRHLNENDPDKANEVQLDPNEYVAQDLVIASTIAGSLAGFISKTAVYPFDLTKRRLQMAGHKTQKGIAKTSTTKHIIKCYSLLDCLLITIKKDGIRGLFNGLTVTLYKANISNVITFTTYEMICHVLRNKPKLTPS